MIAREYMTSHGTIPHSSHTHLPYCGWKFPAEQLNHQSLHALFLILFKQHFVLAIPTDTPAGGRLT